jgi:hypothetical protein
MIVRSNVNVNDSASSWDENNSLNLNNRKISGIYSSHNICKVITFTNLIMLMVGVKLGNYSMTSSGMTFIHISNDISNILEIFRIQEGGGEGGGG